MLTKVINTLLWQLNTVEITHQIQGTLKRDTSFTKRPLFMVKIDCSSFVILSKGTPFGNPLIFFLPTMEYPSIKYDKQCSRNDNNLN